MFLVLTDFVYTSLLLKIWFTFFVFNAHRSCFYLIKKSFIFYNIYRLLITTPRSVHIADRQKDKDSEKKNIPIQFNPNRQ